MQIEVEIIVKWKGKHHLMRVLSAEINTRINISNWPLLRRINYEIMIGKKLAIYILPSPITI